MNELKEIDGKEATDMKIIDEVEEEQNYHIYLFVVYLTVRFQ
jgi:hypothetical protein